MSDERLGVTRERLCTLARLYFDHLGATVTETGDGWCVELPDDPPEWLADDAGGRQLRLGLDGDDEAPRLAPQTTFTRRLIDAVGTLAPLGTASLTADGVTLRGTLPDWLTDSPATVADVTFRPYYDATLVAWWVRVEIETPSQYQREHLYRITVDPETGETVDGTVGGAGDAAVGGVGDAAVDIPGGDATVGILGDGSDTAGSDDPTVTRATLAESATVAGEAAVERADEVIESVRAEAARAAGAAFDDHRRRVKERIDRLQTERDAVEAALSRVGDDLAADPPRAERLTLLERREELQAERASLTADLSAARDERTDGFRKRRAALADRHAVGVHTRPVAATVCAVERGDLDVTLEDGPATDTLRLAFGLAAGLRERATCPACDRQYTTDNCPRVAAAGVCCERCRS